MIFFIIVLEIYSYYNLNLHNLKYFIVSKIIRFKIILKIYNYYNNLYNYD